MTTKAWTGDERRRDCPYPSCHEPEAAAKRAVQQVFAILGVDVDDPKQVEEFREGLRFGRSMQKLAGRGIVAFIVVACGGAAAALWLGIKTKITSIP